MKKIFSLFLVIAIILTLATSAFAANVILTGTNPTAGVLVEITEEAKVVRATLYLTGPISGVTGANLKIKYDDSVIRPCDEDGKNVLYKAAKLVATAANPYVTWLDSTTGDTSNWTMTTLGVAAADSASEGQAILVNFTRKTVDVPSISVAAEQRLALCDVTFEKQTGATLSAAAITFPATLSYNSKIILGTDNVQTFVNNKPAEMDSNAFKTSYVEPEPGVDKTDLVEAIADAQEVLDTADIGTGVGQHPQSAADTLEAAIEAAQAVVDDATADQATVDAAVTTLDDAVKAFNLDVNEEPDPEMFGDASDVNEIAAIHAAGGVFTPEAGAESLVVAGTAKAFKDDSEYGIKFKGTYFPALMLDANGSKTAGEDKVSFAQNGKWSVTLLNLIDFKIPGSYPVTTYYKNGGAAEETGAVITVVIN